MKTTFNVMDNVDIIDKMPIGILVLRRDLFVAAWNIRLEQWTGLKKNDIVDKDLTSFYPHIKQPRYLDRISSIFDGGPPIVFSSQFHSYFIPCPMPSGDLRYQHTTVIPVKDQNDEIFAIFAIEDVTELTNRILNARELHNAALMEIEERKAIEKELRVSESRIKAIVNTALDAIITIDGTGMIHSANPAVEELFGYDPDELTGRDASLIIPDIFQSGQSAQKKELSANVTDYLHSIIVRGKETQAVNKSGDTVPIELSISEVSLENGVLFTSIIRDITERKFAEKALRESEKLFKELSITDSLTQLYNSRHFFNQLKLEMERSSRYMRPLTLYLLDADNFKQINDTYGHMEGDQVLIGLTSVMRNRIRNFDSAYRYGGEEFVAVFPETTLDQGLIIAERIREEIKTLVFHPTPDVSFSITVSIGVAQFNGFETMQDFVARADKGMYAAKKSGKDRVCTS